MSREDRHSGSVCIPERDPGHCYGVEIQWFGAVTMTTIFLALAPMVMAGLHQRSLGSHLSR